MDQDIERRIRERAYEIWEEEGRPHGREAQHWQQAASEMADVQRENRETGRQAGKSAPKKAAGPKGAQERGAKKSADGGSKGKNSAKTGSGQTRTGIRTPRTGKASSS